MTAALITPTPDLSENIWRNPGEVEGDEIDNDGNGYVDDIYGWSYLWEGDSSNQVKDNLGHGTHVAGTIGAAGNNGIGTAGVSWNVKMMALRALGTDGSGFVSDIVRCIEYVQRMEVPIVNCSFGSPSFSQAEHDAIQSADALFVAAAGNDGMNLDETPAYPASYDLPNIITVAATDKEDSLASFSNYGSSADLAAPGENIFSTTPAGTYSVSSGTSMAAPHVAGAAALVLSANPGMTAQQLKARLTASVDPVAALEGNVASGGRLNLLRALQPSTPALTAFVPAAAPEAPAFTGFAGGDGSASAPYQVSTPAQLNAVRSYPGSHFVQINDIDLSYDTQNPNGAYYNESSGWNPIAEFHGSYNGGGYSVIGLRIASGVNYAALFLVNYGWITNLHMKEVSVSGGNAGSIVGQNISIMKNCSAAGEVLAFGVYAGGLAAINYGGEIHNSFSRASITATGDYTIEAGGISGAGLTQNLTANCYSTGHITVTGAVGERVGGISSIGTIKHCYTTCTISDRDGFGRIWVGQHVEAEGCYSLGNDRYTMGTVLSEEEMKQQQSFSGWDFEQIWQIDPDIDDGYPHLNPSAPMELEVHGFAGGDGSPETPYQEATAEQLNNVRNHMRRYFVQISDIDLSYDTRNPDGAYYNEGKGWYPIGAIEDEFADLATMMSGGYGGGGHQIIGMYINRKELYQASLFSCISGTVQNVALTETEVWGGERTGGIAGSSTGTITRCYTTGSICGEGYIGGIFGYGTAGAVAERCFNLADIRGNAEQSTIYIGGIAGYIQNKLSNCYNAGSITAKETQAVTVYAGGIAGFSGEANLSNCYNAGEINAKSMWKLTEGITEGGQLITSCYGLDRNGFTGYQNGGVKCDLSTMRQMERYANWDFSSIWDIDPGYNQGLPYLRGFRNYSEIQPFSFMVLVNNGAGGGCYSEGSTVHLMKNETTAAQRFTGWTFSAQVSLTNGSSAAADEVYFIMPGTAVTATAVFEAIQYQVQVANGQGSGMYTPDEVVTIVAETNDNMEFVNWTASEDVDLVDPDAMSTSFVMPEFDVEVMANFIPKPEDKTDDTIKYIRLWGKTTKYELKFINWLLCIICFGWIWMAF